MYEELRNIGRIKEWYPYENPCHPENTWLPPGSVQFETFEQAFAVLTKGVSIKNVRFQHGWYTDWSWISLKNTNKWFFDQLDENLNDDCIREVIKYIDILHLIHFVQLNDRFKALTEECFFHLRIFPSTVGAIGLINFRYLLEMFSGSVKELSVSLNAFSTHGFLYDSFKRYILRIIHKCTGPKLKKVYCYGFTWPECENENFDCVLQMFSQRNIGIKFN